MSNNTFHFDEKGRTPWNNVIRPGNWVTHLNAYRDQGVTALPGVVFFRHVGALVLNPDNYGVLDTDGVLVAGTYDLKILSPDLRQDDKPRKDRPFELPAGAKVYKVAVSAPGVREAESLRDAVTDELPGTTEILVEGITTPTILPFVANDGVTVDEARDGTIGFYNPVGWWTDPMEAIVSGASVGELTEPETTVPIQVTTSADLEAHLDPSAGACRNSPSAILVEVCYYLPDAAPDADDVHIPYAVEAGSDMN